MQRTQQLGRYHLLDRIAFGGMAEIYRAKTFDGDGHAHLVAVKRVLAHLVEDEDFIQMLVDEAKIASLLRHPNIARVYEFARALGEYFIAMEHVDGKDVRTILERCRAAGKAIPPQHAAWIAGEVGSGLHAAHCVVDNQGRAMRIIHRDVSPSNVICAYSGEVKLCDFGIAKATLSRVQTKTGVIKGKVKYMSPEQAMGRKLDHRSDIFSLGSCLYEMLSKIPPFTASNEMDLLIKVRDARYRPLREVEPEVPPALEAIVDKALSRSRAARFQSAEEMRLALKTFLAEYMPAYSRSHLGRYLRKMFEADIDRELRLLEEYVVSDPDPENVGENLIADALGPDAPYSKFTPIAIVPVGAPAAGDRSSLSQINQFSSEASTNPTDLGPGEPAGDTTPPPGPLPDLHSASTMIIDRKKVQGAPRPGAGAGVPADRWPGSPGGRDPRELDPAIHEAPTLILKRK